MIIECINCSKKFDVNSDLIPENGRTIQCGSCNHVWFYKKNDNEKLVISNDEFIKSTKISTIDDGNKKFFEETSLENNDLSKRKKTPIKKKSSEIVKYQKKTNFSFGKFLSYIIVILISFFALILIIDTFKFPLYNFFPNLEFLLFNFYETLKDIKLFIKDLI